MSVVNHEAASSALYHIEAIERRMKFLKQHINPQAGVIIDTMVVKSLMEGLEDDITDLHNDVIVLL